MPTHRFLSGMIRSRTCVGTAVPRSRVKESLMADHDLNSMRVAERLAPILASAGCDHEHVDGMPEVVWAMAVDVARNRDPEWKPAPHYVASPMTRRFVKALLTPTPEPDPTADPFAGIGYRS
jgi:hypothetical protein